MSSLTAWDSRCFSIRSISILSKPPLKIEIFQLPSSSSFALISARVKQSSSSSAESMKENITFQVNIQYSYKPTKNPMLVWLKIIFGDSSLMIVRQSQNLTSATLSCKCSYLFFEAQMCFTSQCLLFQFLRIQFAWVNPTLISHTQIKGCLLTAEKTGHQVCHVKVF